MIDNIEINDVPYSQTPDEQQNYVGWYRNGEKPLSGGNADGDYSGILNRPVWHLYNNIDTIDGNVNKLTVKVNEVIVEVNDLRDLFQGIEDYTDLITQVNNIDTRTGQLETDYTSLSGDVSQLQTNYTTLSDDLTGLQNNYDTLSTTVSSNNDLITGLSNDVGDRNPSDTRNISLFEDTYLIRQDIGNYIDYDIFGNVSLGNEPSGIKSRIESISSSLNINETAIETNEQDITKLQQQVGSDVSGSETGLELRTKTLETEQQRMLSYGGIRLSINSAETNISTVGTYVPMVIDESVAMNVNRNVAIGNQNSIIAGATGAYVLSADVFLASNSLASTWAQLEIYLNGLPTGINAYCRIHSDGKGYASLVEPVMLENEDEIELRVTLRDTTGVIVVEDFSMHVSPM